MKKRMAAAFMAIILSAGMFAGCGGKGNEESSSKESSQKKTEQQESGKSEESNSSEETKPEDPYEAVHFAAYDRNREVTDTFTTLYKYLDTSKSDWEESYYSLELSVSDLGYERTAVSDLDSIRYHSGNAFEADKATLYAQGGSTPEDVKRFGIVRGYRDIWGELNSVYYIGHKAQVFGEDSVEYNSVGVGFYIKPNYDSWTNKKMYETTDDYVKELKKEVLVGVENAKDSPNNYHVELTEDSAVYDYYWSRTEYVTFNGIPGTIAQYKDTHTGKVESCEVNSQIVDGDKLIGLTTGRISPEYCDIAVDIMRNTTWDHLKDFCTSEEVQSGIYRCAYLNDYILEIKFNKDEGQKGLQTESAEPSRLYDRKDYSKEIFLEFGLFADQSVDLDGMERYDGTDIIRHVGTEGGVWDVPLPWIPVKLPAPYVDGEGKVYEYLIVKAGYDYSGRMKEEEIMDFISRFEITITGNLGNTDLHTTDTLRN